MRNGLWSARRFTAFFYAYRKHVSRFLQKAHCGKAMYVRLSMYFCVLQFQLVSDDDCGDKM